MNTDFKLKGVLIDNEKDPRDYNISMFIPGQDEIKDEEFCLKLPELDIIINQKCYNSCVGHSFAMAKSILEYNRTNKWMDIDPYMIYGTRYTGEYTGMGMYPYQGAKVLLKDGAYLRRDFNIQQEVPQLIDTVKDWKSTHFDKVQEAKKLQISAYYYTYNDNQIKTSLKNGMPISVAYPIYTSFYNVKDDGIVSIPKSNEKLEGYHQMLIVGWTKHNQWIVINSWGNSYGFKGMYFIPFSYKFDSAIVVSDTISPCKYKAKQIEFSINNKQFIAVSCHKDIIDYFTKFLIRKIYVVDNDYLLYEFTDDTFYRYELGTWSIKENRINRKRREFKNKDYWGKKPKED